MLEHAVISGFADEIDGNTDRQIAVLEKLGIGCVEFRSGDGKGVADYTLKEAKRLKEKLDAHGLSVSAVGSPIGKINITDPFEPHLEKLRHVAQLAHIWDTPYIRMFSFFIPEGQEPETYRDEVMRRIEAMVACARREEVVLLHENEKDIYGDTASRCLDLMKNFYGDHFRWYPFFASTSLIPATIRLTVSEFILGIITPTSLVFFVRSIWAWAEGWYPVCSTTWRILSLFSSLT